MSNPVLRICGLMKTTLLDYPGKLACTVFLPGCNMRCPFCHNPRVVFGKDDPISIDEVRSFLKKRSGILDGICITGGEPTLFGEALLEFAREIKGMGFLLKLDTNGTNPSLLKGMLDEGLLDYVAMDIKSSPESYSKACGCDIEIEKIKESISLLKSSEIDYEFRTTVVREIHSRDDILGAARLIDGGKRYFLQSFVDSGDILSGEGLSAPKKEELEEMASLASTYIPTSVRGV